MSYPNESGIRPVEYKILIKPDIVEEKTAGGIIKPDKTHEMEGWAQVKGTLVAIGGAAFGDPFTAEEHDCLVPGARVYYSKYSGITFTGSDGEEYRICADKDLGGVVENENAVPIVQARKRGGLSAA